MCGRGWELQGKLANGQGLEHSVNRKLKSLSEEGNYFANSLFRGAWWRGQTVLLLQSQSVSDRVKTKEAHIISWGHFFRKKRSLLSGSSVLKILFLLLFSLGYIPRIQQGQLLLQLLLLSCGWAGVGRGQWWCQMWWRWWFVWWLTNLVWPLRNKLLKCEELQSLLVQHKNQ